MADWLRHAEGVNVEETLDGAPVVTPPGGKLAIAMFPALQWALREAATGPERIILDLHELTVTDAAGLYAILSANQTLSGRFLVRAPNIEVRRLLAITGADRWLEMVPGPVCDSPVERGQANIAYVKRLWDAFGSGGAAALADLVPEDVVWRPACAEGVVLLGTRELMRFCSTRDLPILIARDFSLVGEDVVVRGEAPQLDGYVKEIWWLYHFDGPRLIEAISYDRPPVAGEPVSPAHIAAPAETGLG